MTVSEKRYQPFYCGTQRADWRGSNCRRCTKQYDEEACDWRCEIEQALDMASFGDGTVSEHIARRMGFLDAADPAYGWKCPEVEWTEEWKAEWEQIKHLTPEERDAYYRSKIVIEIVE